MYGFGVEAIGKSEGLAVLWNLGFSGDPFTWSNNHQHPDSIRERIDRAVANAKLTDIFPNNSIQHLPANSSDHAALLIKLDQTPVFRGKRIRPVRFEAAWIQHDQCEMVIRYSWQLGSVMGMGQHLSKQLDTCKQKLKSWSQRVFKRDKDTVDKLEKRLQFIQSGIMMKEMKEEEAAILGTWVYEKEEIQQCILSHFHEVFSSGRPSPIDIARGTDKLQRVVDLNMADDLVQPYTEEEVTKALFQMVPLKSPGLDAFEINHFLNTKTTGRQDFMAMKLDVSKAYDKVEWTFLEQGENNLASWFHRGGFVKETLSPLSVSFVHRSIQLIDSKWDDTLIFAQASLESMQSIKEILEVYRLASGQEINFHKSSVAFSRNTNNGTRQVIAQELNI
ncbi:UNVERIFIED_CONTAM: hypothetical protein Slati_3512400 [Sesamum latifolium]|uniref:Reverse transcriptase n=1 Tax=Sesamum latifolium TaxID=2727402 RepID=A0AAW2UKS2_9LAMI